MALSRLSKAYLEKLIKKDFPIKDSDIEKNITEITDRSISYLDKQDILKIADVFLYEMQSNCGAIIWTSVEHYTQEAFKYASFLVKNLASSGGYNVILMSGHKRNLLKYLTIDPAWKCYLEIGSCRKEYDVNQDMMYLYNAIPKEQMRKIGY